MSTAAIRSALCAATALCASLMLGAGPAQAQSVEDQIKALSEQVKALQSQLEALQKAQAGAETAANAQPSAVREVPKAQNDYVEIKDKGAPQFVSDDFTFKVRGRLMVDFGHVEGAGRFNEPGLGTTTELRRARIGAEGSYHDWGYKLEVDFANNDVSVADAYISWKGPVEVDIGHQQLPNSLEMRTSSRFTSFMERASFTSAFGLGRQLGVSVKKSGENYVLHGGIYSSGAVSGDDEQSGYTFGGRAVYNPKVEGNQLHFGAWSLYRDNGSQPSRFRDRPLIHTTDTRFIDTGNLNTDSDFVYGVEAAGIFGPVYVSSEWAWLNADLATPVAPGLDDEFSAKGGYVQAGYYFTGESRGYSKSGGSFDRTKPLRPLSKGGPGAWSVNLAYDYVELNDAGAGITGGSQTGYLANLIWVPENHLRFIAQFGHADIDDRIYRGVEVNSIDSIGMRAEVDW